MSTKFYENTDMLKLVHFRKMYIMKTPSDIKLSKDKKQLTITFDQFDYPLSSEFLRVYSPSAEVQAVSYTHLRAHET